MPQESIMAYRKSTSASQRAAEIFSAASSHARESGKKPSLLLRLFRGEVSLTITFWTFFVSLPLLGDLVFTHLIFPHLSVSSAVGTASIFMWAAFMLVYVSIMSVGVWRASAHARSALWGMLAKVGAVLGVAGAVAYLFMWYGSWMILSNA